MGATITIKPSAGHQATKPNPRHSAKYREYIASSEWAALRAEMLDQAGYACESCGVHRDDVSHLEVHHLTYENLGDESYDDLQVLCPQCHEKADKVRAEEAVWEARVNGYARKRWGILQPSFHVREQAFLEFLEREEER